jgi:hypothetical protein
MQIDSALSGNGYSARPHMIERKSDDVAQREGETRKRASWAMTGSSTLLSSSLANALWTVEGNRDTAPSTGGNSSTILQSAPATREQVEDIYSEF